MPLIKQYHIDRRLVQVGDVIVDSNPDSPHVTVEREVKRTFAPGTILSDATADDGGRAFLWVRTAKADTWAALFVERDSHAIQSCENDAALAAKVDYGTHFVIFDPTAPLG